MEFSEEEFDENCALVEKIVGDTGEMKKSGSSKKSLDSAVQKKTVC